MVYLHLCHSLIGRAKAGWKIHLHVVLLSFSHHIMLPPKKLFVKNSRHHFRSKSWLSVPCGSHTQTQATCWKQKQFMISKTQQEESKLLKALRERAQFSNLIFGFLFCYLFAANYTSILTHLQHYRVGIFAWRKYQGCKEYSRSAMIGMEFHLLRCLILIYLVSTG